MTNLVLYRKYRPKTFAEVVGQEHVIQTLTNALRAGDVVHAYLFHGPRGTGKTTVARLLAKAVNCANLANEPDGRVDAKLSIRRSSGGAKADSSRIEPCNVCRNCEDITSLRALDIIEIDAASNRRIDDVRELKEIIRSSPISLPRKVFIIDEVHMLTGEAFNALLKTLEEPPSHAMFILATTDLHKVPLTIISRTQHFDFKKIHPDTIVQRLRYILEKEGVRVDDESLREIARAAGGSVRDAESLLSQVISFKADNIAKDDVVEILGIVDRGVVSVFFEFLAKKDAQGAVRFINNLIQEGIDLVQFAKGTLGYARDLLIAKIDLEILDRSGLYSSQELKEIISSADRFSETELKKLISLLVEAENEVRRANIPQLPLELAVLGFLQDQPINEQTD